MAVAKKKKKSDKDQSIFVCQLTKTQIMKLKSLLEEQKYEFKDEKYSFLKAVQGDLSLTVYLKGRLIIQGPGTKEFVENFIEPKILGLTQFVPDSKGNREFRDRIGVNEYGKSDYFGPLIITSVFINEEGFHYLSQMKDLAKDIKRLSKNKILDLNPLVRKHCKFSIVTIGPERYNELYEKMGDMNRLLAWGHSRAIENILFKVDCDDVIVNQFGDKNLIIEALMKKGKTIRLRQQQNAENDIAVAVAAVISRAENILRMDQLCEEVKEDLLRGNNAEVEKQAKELIERDGAAILVKVSKLHFPMTKRVILG